MPQSNPPDLIAPIVALIVGLPVARPYWLKYQISYDLDVSWHSSRKAVRCILRIDNPTNTIRELKTITAQLSKNIKKVPAQVAVDIPIKRLDKEINIPSHFQETLHLNAKIHKSTPYLCSFFVKIPDDKEL